MSEPFVGEIRMFGGNFAPAGWALCNGQILNISTNTPLFSILGTNFGGNGQSTFGLPNLQGRVPIHWGNGAGLSPYTLGQNAGVETVTLTQNQTPAHSHLINCVNGSNANSTKPSGAYPGAITSSVTTTKVDAYSSAAPDTQMNAAAVSAIGGSQPHPNIQPYLCVTFIIALQGIFPSRN
jgi:microcystin-dependent protein